MGGDRGPQVVIPAVLAELDAHPSLEVLLVGQQDQLESLLTSHNITEHPRLKLHHADEVVNMDDASVTALRHKKSASMRVALELVRDGLAQACVSAGNTGALMATAKYILKTLPGVDRPAIIASIPALNGRETFILDLGANVDCSAEQLHQFALMGAVLASSSHDLQQPDVALLNVGTEVLKGSAQVRLAAQLLEAHPGINYQGFVEGNDIFRGQVDVIVCDGFVGNVALKASEGLAGLINGHVHALFNRTLWGRLIGLIFKPFVKKLQQGLDPERYNGASLVGLNGIVVKSHGNAGELGFRTAINKALTEVEYNIPERIRHELYAMLMEV